MGYLKEYIDTNIDLGIKEFMYININEDNNVYEYEITDKVTELEQLDLAPVSLLDFLETHKNFIGMYSPKNTFICLGHDTLIHSELVNETLNGINYCHATIGLDSHDDSAVKANPVEFLVDNVPAYTDIFFIDVSNMHQFNFANEALILGELDSLDEWFQNERVTRVYKKYNNYYIFY